MSKCATNSNKYGFTKVVQFINAENRMKINLFFFFAVVMDSFVVLNVRNTIFNAQRRAGDMHYAEI